MTDNKAGSESVEESKLFLTKAQCIELNAKLNQAFEETRTTLGTRVRFASSSNKETFSELITSIENTLEHTFKGNRVFQEAIESCNSVEEIKAVLSGFVMTSFTDMALATYIQKMLIISVCETFRIFEELPKNSDYDTIRSKLAETENKVIDTLLPIKKALDDANKRLNRGDGLYV